MTMVEFLMRQMPEYSDTLYLDGYSPSQILAAAHKAMLQDGIGADSQEGTEISISSEVSTK